MNKLLDECIAEKQPNENINKILDFSESHAARTPKDALKLISKKLFNNSPPLISLRAAKVLDICSINAGNAFIHELSSKDFNDQVKNGFGKLDHNVKNKLCETFKRLSEEFRGNKSYELMLEIYPWIRSNFPDTNQNILEADKMSKNKMTREQTMAEEEKQLAKAINLSLQDSKGKAGQSLHSNQGGQPGSKNAYSDVSYMLKISPQAEPGPVKNTQPTKAPSKTVQKVRALYDFEAAEDNELSFKAGELIVLVDDSDENWWQGSNHNGEGLFPAQFVTKVLDDVPDAPAVSNSVQLNSAKSSLTKQSTIEPEKIEKCWYLLSQVDPSSLAEQDTAEMLELETRCAQMTPLVDTEIEKADKMLEEMQQLETKMGDALKQFNEIVKANANAPRTSVGQHMPPYGNAMQHNPQNMMPDSSQGMYPHPQQAYMPFPQQGNPLMQGGAVGYPVYPSDQYAAFANQGYPTHPQQMSTHMPPQMPPVGVPPNVYPMMNQMTRPSSNSDFQQPGSTLLQYDQSKPNPQPDAT